MSNLVFFKAGAKELAPHCDYLVEFAQQKFTNIKPNSLSPHYNDGIEICFVTQGTYRWRVEDRDFSLLPGDAFVTSPWQQHGSPDKVLDIGILSWLILKPKCFSAVKQLSLGSWSKLDNKLQRTIGKLISTNQHPVLHHATEIGFLMRKINMELSSEMLGSEVKVKLLLDDLLIEIGRAILHQYYKQETDQAFTKKLAIYLQETFNKKTTVSDWATHFAMSPTSFNTKVLQLTGFSPARYKLHLQVEQAKEILRQKKTTITKIAFQCGFSSSQHLATAFKQHTGKTAKTFRCDFSKCNNTTFGYLDFPKSIFTS